ncbi:lysophospholipid acyltransferase family protein [Plantibacter sp. Mn2098]|uniref:lysophospholipid acyltransferase family protein n=1 Tax=Plantibacter sp. Mn2098 TaxID=3395266 RepID=UPI003BBB78B1
MSAEARFTSTAHACARFVAQRMLLKPLVWSLTRVTVHGREQLKGVEGTFIVVANHTSHLDAPLVVGAMPRKLSRYLAAGVAADYFFDVPWRRWFAALFFNAFPVDRSGDRKRAGMSKDLLASGVPLLLFPEGGRSATGRLGAFKPGAAALAASHDIPCVPVVVVGTHLAMPKGRNWPVAGRPRVDVVFGAPIRSLSGETPVQLTARIVAQVVALRASIEPRPPVQDVLHGASREETG